MNLGSLPVTLPFPWQHLLVYLGTRLIPEVESIEGDQYVRRVGERRVSVAFDAAAASLIVTADGRVKTDEILRRVAALFDIKHDATSVAKHLRRSPVLAGRLASVPGMRPPAAWSAFELCVRTILGQQVTVAAAGTLMRRLVQRCGEVTPECVIKADLAKMGMPGKRVETIQILANAVLEQRVRFEQPWAKLEAELKQLPGFGPWTRGYLAIRLGREPDALPETDIGLIRAAQVDSSTALLQLAEQWRPYRSYAATYLWST
jgi:3-methyladenine DNA glycosylase/8-oxoguanine DNA glycosylase